VLRSAAGRRRGLATRSRATEPVANNAVAALPTPAGCALVTALGIDGSRVAEGIHTRAWMFDGAWTALPDLAGPGRIAGSAVALRGRVYVLGGYSVAPGGPETSHASLDVLDVETPATIS
jgi:hypothetical protein